VEWKYRREFCKDLKKVYTAINRQAAFDELQVFKKTWQARYKYAVDSWEQNWENLSNYFEYPLELRKIIYTTNTIENLNRGIRKYTKTKSQFPNENAASKSVFLSIQNIEKSWTGVIQNWALILDFLSIAT
jgi:putative transposase